jgi:hypothetical protein
MKNRVIKFLLICTVALLLLSPAAIFLLHFIFEKTNPNMLLLGGSNYPTAIYVGSICIYPSWISSSYIIICLLFCVMLLYIFLKRKYHSIPSK